MIAFALLLTGCLKVLKLRAQENLAQPTYFSTHF